MEQTTNTCPCRNCFTYWRLTGKTFTPITPQTLIDRANKALRNPKDHITNPHKETN